jgi:hypothetical protein
MSNLINLEELLHNNSRPKKFKEDYFNKVLTRCHNLIKRYNKKEMLKSCKFEVPIYEFGVPVYNFNELLNFLYVNLKNNGLYVKILNNGRQLYISWDEKDVDFNSYSELKKKQQELMFLNAIQRPSEIIENNVQNDNNALLLKEGVVINREKHLQAQKIKEERERFYKDLCNKYNSNDFNNFKSDNRR